MLRCGPQLLARCSTGEESVPTWAGLSPTPPRASSPGTPAGVGLRRAPSPLSKPSQRQRGAGAAATRALLGKHGGWELISHGHLSVCSLASPIVTHPPGTAQRWHSLALLPAPAWGTSPGSRSATLSPTPAGIPRERRLPLASPATNAPGPLPAVQDMGRAPTASGGCTVPFAQAGRVRARWQAGPSVGST